MSSPARSSYRPLAATGVNAANKTSSKTAAITGTSNGTATSTSTTPPPKLGGGGNLNNIPRQASTGKDGGQSKYDKPTAQWNEMMQQFKRNMTHYSKKALEKKAPKYHHSKSYQVQIPKRLMVYVAAVFLVLPVIGFLWKEMHQTIHDEHVTTKSMHHQSLRHPHRGQYSSWMNNQLGEIKSDKIDAASNEQPQWTTQEHNATHGDPAQASVHDNSTLLAANVADVAAAVAAEAPTVHHSANNEAVTSMSLFNVVANAELPDPAAAAVGVPQAATNDGKATDDGGSEDAGDDGNLGKIELSDKNER